MMSYTYFQLSKSRPLPLLPLFVSSVSLFLSFIGILFHLLHDLAMSINHFAEHNGAYLEDSKPVPPSHVRSWARDELEAERLWKLSEDLVGKGV